MKSFLTPLLLLTTIFAQILYPLQETSQELQQEPKRDPWYFSNNGEPRPVKLALYYYHPDVPKHLRFLVDYWRQHAEVHVGNTAYTIFFDIDVQQVQYRPVSSSKQVFGNEMIQEIPMCRTTRTDDEILEYLKDHWKGPAHIFERDCQMFSKFLLEFLCVDQKLRYPRRWSAQQPIRNLFGHIAQHQESYNQARVAACSLNKIDRRILNGMHDRDDWGIVEFNAESKKKPIF